MSNVLSPPIWLILTHNLPIQFEGLTHRGPGNQSWELVLLHTWPGPVQEALPRPVGSKAGLTLRLTCRFPRGLSVTLHGGIGCEHPPARACRGLTQFLNRPKACHHPGPMWPMYPVPDSQLAPVTKNSLYLVKVGVDIEQERLCVRIIVP